MTNARDRLKAFWKTWQRIARAVGALQARAVLTLLYAVLVLPFGVMARWFWDPLRIKEPPMRWLDSPNEIRDLGWARKQ